MMRSLLLTVALFAVSASVYGQSPDTVWLDSLQAYWERTNAEYRDPEHSPLLPEDRASFTELERYAPDPAFKVNANFRPRTGKSFGMRTTTDRLPTYQAVGILRFELSGRRQRLTVFRNIELSTRPGFENYLFVPFTDPTNAETTYGGGRYIDLQGPLEKTVVLDLNKAYNPYCAYGGRYSCPIPPRENHLTVPVQAGVKAFDH